MYTVVASGVLHYVVFGRDLIARFDARILIMHDVWPIRLSASSVNPQAGA